MNNKAEWEKELRILLDKVQNHPSADLTAERERIVLLNTLIAANEKTVPA
jgi:hypothetical protein